MGKGRIYTVHYGDDPETTCQFAESMIPYLHESLDLVIVNNSATTDLNLLNNGFITVINAGYNAGYFGGIKIGIEKKPFDNIDFVIVCNNDIRIINADFFGLLKEKLVNYDIIAPSIRTLRNIEQNPHRQNAPSLFRKVYYRIYFSGYFLAWLFNKLIVFKKNSLKNLVPLQQEKEIFSPHGSCFIFSSSYFEKGGFIDDGSFLYAEEDSIAAIAQKYRMKIGFVPSLQILHLESISTGKGISKQKYAYQKEAYKYIKDNYRSIFN